MIQALLAMNLPVDINQQMNNPQGHNHEKIWCDVTVGDDIGFRWNKQTQSYELVTDLQTWSREVPPKRFIDKVSQQYAIELLSATARSEGFEIEKKEVNTEGAVELTVTRWG